MIRVYTAESMVDAQLVCDALLTDGLEARISGGYLSGAAGELPMGQLITVWIAEPSMLDRARAVVNAFESSFVRGSERGGDSRRCPGCGEVLESQFSHCWQCGHSLVE